MKFLVALVNSFFGIALTLLGFLFAFVTAPKLQSLYSSLNTDVQVNPYPTIVALIVLGIVNLVVALANFNLIFKEKNELFFKLGLILVVITFVLSGLLVGFLATSALNPIYSINQALN